MKRMICLLLLLSVSVVACKSKKASPPPDKKVTEKAEKTENASKPSERNVVGIWTSPSLSGFVAEFKSDHTGTTTTPAPVHRGVPTAEAAKIPFKWSIEGDKVKITEGKKSYFGKIDGKHLEVDMGDAKTSLEKVK